MFRLRAYLVTMKVKRLDDNHIQIIFDNDDESKPFREALQWNNKYELVDITCELKSYGIIDYNEILKQIDENKNEFYTEEESRRILFGDDDETNGENSKT